MPEEPGNPQEPSWEQAIPPLERDCNRVLELLRTRLERGYQSGQMQARAEVREETARTADPLDGERLDRIMYVLRELGLARPRGRQRGERPTWDIGSKDVTQEALRKLFRSGRVYRPRRADSPDFFTTEERRRQAAFARSDRGAYQHRLADDQVYPVEVRYTNGRQAPDRSTQRYPDLLRQAFDQL